MCSGTPRKHPRVEVNQDQQTVKREEIGHHMNDETLECEVEVFLASYLPRHQFSEETYKAISAAGVARARDHFKENFPFHMEAEISSSLQEIVGALVKAREDLGERRNLQYSSSPNQTVISCIIGGNFKIDASLNNANGSEALHTTNIVVAMEFKLSRSFDTVRKVSAFMDFYYSSLPLTVRTESPTARIGDSSYYERRCSPHVYVWGMSPLFSRDPY
jgi:hypothetical protein